MFISNKKKYFNEIYLELVNKSIKAIGDIHNILTDYGAKPNIEKDKMKFILSTFLFNLFFIEGPLQYRYSSKYEEETSLIVEAMLCEVSNRTGYATKEVCDIYITLRNNLDAFPLDDGKFQGENPFGLAAVYYRLVAFDGEYKPEELGYNVGEPEAAIAKVFQSLWHDTDKYLHTYSELLTT